MFAARKIRPLLLLTNIVSLRPKNVPFTPKDNTHTVNTFLNYKMPQKNMHSTTSKRKTPPSPQKGSGNSTKKVKSADDSTDPINKPDSNSQIAEENGIVLPAFYGPEMSNERALAYKEGQLPRPIELLNSALAETRLDRAGIEVKDAVVHWFKSDLRTRDNRALRAASEKAKEKNVPLITMYIVSPQDFEAHLTSPPRVDFVLRTLQILKADLAKLNIPLYVETVAKRKRIPERILELLRKWGANHLYANMEIEVDELRRDEGLVRKCLENGIAMDVLPDTCVVHPGELVTGSGKQYSVYTPWFRSWVAHIHSHPELLELSEAPTKNPADARQKYAELFESTIPPAPENKRLNDEDKRRLQSMWPAGEHEAQQRLRRFADQRIGDYEAHRNFPADDATSSLSVDFSSGTLSSRTAVRTARGHNSTKRLDGGDMGIQTWIKEVAWRDFYRHILAHWPYIWYVISHALEDIFTYTSQYV
jgi:deoxyribodipyrimidine photo-lyase